MKKAIMSLSTVILVFSTLFLVVTSLFLFTSQKNDMTQKLDVSPINQVYIQRAILDFEIREIADKIVYEENPDEQFKAELEKYRDDNGNYLDINFINLEKQINSNTVYFENGNTLVVNFDRVLVDTSYYPIGVGAREYNLVYSYKFHYIKTGVV